MSHCQLVVLGGGPGGYAAAFLAADLGLEVALIDEQTQLGGTCLLEGCIPSKALLHVARVLTETKEVADWGVSFVPPEIDLEAMRANKQGLIKKLSKGLSELAKRRKVRVISARGSFVDSQTLQLSGGDPASDQSERITFDHCIVSTGSRPVMPAAFELPTDRVMDSSGALDLADVPASLLVVGGGYIGLEMGTVYAALGSQVTVVEMTEGLLPGVDRDLVKPLAKRMESVFDSIRLGTKVANLKDRGEQVEVTLEGAEATETAMFDRVLVSIGRRPNSENLGLENTQVKLDQRGFIEADAQQRTADPHILAIGDVAGEPMLAHKAAYQGKVAAEVLNGEAASFDAQAVPAVVFTDPEIAWAGLTADEARSRECDVKIAQYPWQASGRAQAVGTPVGLTKWIIEPETDRVLGCGIVGTGAGELISEAVLAIEMGSTIRDIAASIHPHPTLSETLAFAGEVHLGTATEVYRPKRERRGK